MTVINTVDVVGDEVLAASIIDRSITEIVDNMVGTIADNAFRTCSLLTKATFYAVTSIGLYAFNGCTILETADFYLAKWIYGMAFGGCSKLQTLILRSETLCTISSSSDFSGSPIAKGTGYIYVPRALLSDDDASKDYRRATNWSKHANQFRALEDYTVDGTITGELDPTKI